MDPILGAAVIGGGAQLLGGYFNMQAQREANAANQASAREQMAFQRDMSDTSYQRAVKDMRLAGINPMMAYTMGGASSPAGASASNTAAGPGDLGAGLASSAKDYINQKRERQLMTSQVDLQQAQIAVAKSQQNLNASSARRANADAKLLETELPAAKSRSTLENSRNQLDQKALLYDAVMSRASRELGTGASAMSILRGGMRGLPPRGEPGKIPPRSPPPAMPKRRDLTRQEVERLGITKDGKLFDTKTGEIHD